MSLTSLSPAFRPLLGAWDTWLLTLLAGVAFPIFAYFSLYRKLKETPEIGATKSRRQIYLSVIGAEWLLVAGLGVVANRHRLSMADLGQHLAHPRRILAVTLALLAVFGILIAHNLRELSRTSPEEVAKHLGRARSFVPSGTWELTLWAVMAMTTGLCEELLFRGWMLQLFGCALGSVWVGLTISSVLFGLAHAYQGPKGILTTGLVGLVLGLVYLGAGSLVPSQIIHAMVNLVNGFLGAVLLARLKSPEALGG